MYVLYIGNTVYNVSVLSVSEFMSGSKTRDGLQM